jgi:chemotaxis regulatin CheY-phosphate phosphatase CheZ
MKDIDKYIEDSIANINEDRDVTKSLLKDIMMYLSGDEARHEKVGQVAAKYVETLQRSNEQLVKVVALMQKRTSKSNEFTDEDKAEIFELLKDSG